MKRIVFLLLWFVSTVSVIWEISDIFTPESCSPVAEYDDHLLLEIDIVFGNGTVTPVSKKPNQLTHLMLEETGLPMAEALHGACANQTRSISFPAGKDVDTSPIRLKNKNEISAYEGSISVILRVDHITDASDYEIFDAFKSGNLSLVLDLIDTHRGINGIDEWGQTPLMIAIINHHMVVIAALLNTRRPMVDLNIAKSSGFTALFYAVEHAPVSIFQALLRRGADPNVTLGFDGSSGNTPLHIACLLEKLKHAELLLEYGANPLAKNQYGLVPLQLLPKEAVTSTKLNFRKLFENAFTQGSAANRGRSKSPTPRSDL